MTDAQRTLALAFLPTRDDRVRAAHRQAVNRAYPGIFGKLSDQFWSKVGDDDPCDDWYEAIMLASLAYHKRHMTAVGDDD